MKALPLDYIKMHIFLIPVFSNTNVMESKQQWHHSIYETKTLYYDTTVKMIPVLRKFCHNVK